MQKFLAAILFVAFLGQTFNQGFFYMDYVFQKKEYLKRCENKARPQLACNGKCQLMKKIKEQQEKEQGQPPELKLAAKAEIVVSAFQLNLPAPAFADSDVTYALINFGSPIDRSSSFFHPPDLA